MRAAHGAALILALVFATGASIKPQAVEGAWVFQTEPYDGGCRMTGELQVSPARKDEHQCKLVAREQCPGFAQPILTHQNCTLTRADGGVRIVSVIVKSTSPHYAPDNFELTQQKDGTMRGRLRSADTAPVVFYRAEAAVS